MILPLVQEEFWSVLTIVLTLTRTQVIFIQGEPHLKNIKQQILKPPLPLFLSLPYACMHCTFFKQDFQTSLEQNGTKHEYLKDLNLIKI